MIKPVPQSLKIFLALGLVTSFLGVRKLAWIPQKEKALLKEALGKTSFEFADLQKKAKAFQVEIPTLSEAEKKRAPFGKALFSDSELSQNGKIACATCHQPEKAFTDGLTRAQGLTSRPKNTPTLINSFSGFWFYWDGRTDSLASQSLNPLEDPAEHGFSRGEMAHLVFRKYRKEYEELYGKLSESFVQKLPPRARPQKISVSVSDKVIKYALASSVNPKLLSELGKGEVENSTEQVRKYRKKLASQESAQKDEAFENYQKLSKQDRNDLDHFFANIGLSFEAYEKSILALESPFDSFIKQWISDTDPNPRTHFSKHFGFKEFLGFQLFQGKGQCQLCHLGPHFKDNQFHNIGLSQAEDSIDLGRSQGILTVRADPFNCKGIFKSQSERQKSESCQDLDFLNKDTPEAIGSFKTPTLRNIKETGPYMHDGRFETLKQVLDHYNQMDTHSGVGFREETLKPLKLSPLELDALESFLLSLSSPVRELPY